MRYFADSRTRAWAEVDLGAMVQNIRSIRAFVGPSVRIMAVVKADAYGHGARAIGACLAAVDPTIEFGVATTGEAVELRAQIPAGRIYILSPTLPEEASDVLECGAIPVLSTRESVASLSTVAMRAGTMLPVHMEVDTGMGRNGVLPGEAPSLALAISQAPGLRLEGVMTHFSDAEGSPDLTRNQIQLFEECLSELASMGIHAVRHACNTAGLLLYPEAHFDMVRPGLAVYGLLPTLPDGAPHPHLEPVMALRARVLLVRSLPAGSTISYGGRHRLTKDSRVAVLGIGYADGLPRHLSQRADVLIRGHRVPLIGTICMDVCMADVTDVPEPIAGDVATLIGTDGEHRIRAEDLARAIDTTEHEITTRLGPRLPRHYTGLC